MIIHAGIVTPKMPFLIVPCPIGMEIRFGVALNYADDDEFQVCRYCSLLR